VAQQVDEEAAPLQQVGSLFHAVGIDELRDTIDLVVDVMEPELRRLMRRLKEPLLRIRQKSDRLLQLQQLRNANVALVVRAAFAFEDWTGVSSHGVLSAEC